MNKLSKTLAVVVGGVLSVVSVKADDQPGFFDGGDPNAGTFTAILPSTEGIFLLQNLIGADPGNYKVIPGDVVLLATLGGGHGSANFAEVLHFDNSGAGGNAEVTIHLGVNASGYGALSSNVAFSDNQNYSGSGTLVNDGSPKIFQFNDGVIYTPDKGVSVPTLAYQVVPEPATYAAGALLLLPFALGSLRKLRRN